MNYNELKEYLETIYSKIIEDKVKKYQKKYGFNMIHDGNVRSYNNEADAFKHTFLQADLTLRFGAYVAKYLGDKHETDNTENNSGEMKMDLWNNNIGRRIGLKIRLRHLNIQFIEFFILANLGYFDDEIAEEVMKVMLNKEIITSPDDKRKYPEDFIIQEKQKRDARLRKIKIFLLFLNLIYNNQRQILKPINKINNKPLGFNAPQQVVNNTPYYTPQSPMFNEPMAPTTNMLAQNGSNMTTGLNNIYNSEQAIMDKIKQKVRKAAFDKVFNTPNSSNSSNQPMPEQDTSTIVRDAIKEVQIESIMNRNNNIPQTQYFTPNPYVSLNPIPITPVQMQPMNIMSPQQTQNTNSVDMTALIGGLADGVLKIYDKYKQKKSKETPLPKDNTQDKLPAQQAYEYFPEI